MNDLAYTNENRGIRNYFESVHVIQISLSNLNSLLLLNCYIFYAANYKQKVLTFCVTKFILLKIGSVRFTNKYFSLACS